MSTFDKVVKLACKPKAAPPKAKYLDPIIAATWSDDGSIHDVCKALTPRFREPNAIVVFKALIVLHTMMRNGATDNVLQYLSSSEVLRLHNVSASNWEGYHAPDNLQNYARYLDARIRAYRELKHDAIRVQSETNRDMRNSQAIEETLQEANVSSRKRKTTVSNGTTGLGQNGPQRSKTIMGRKLRVMTVEKGLLRETKAVQRMVDALIECRFYLDDLEDELTITALRMLTKDLLILFQALNEGVINVLEHYFEMSHIDAKEALTLYRHFCKETERVVEYLGVAKKLQNLLNVPIPNLRHAPVSLAGSLEEYLNDPNFEQNRIEYKTNKELADRNAREGVKTLPSSASKPSDPVPSLPTSSASVSQAVSSQPEHKPAGNKELIDFFSAIEEEQQPMFNPQTNSPTSNYFQQQAQHNPFVHRQQIGDPYGQQQLQIQPTGFIAPQQTSFISAQQPGPANPFGLQSQQQAPSFPLLQAQSTGFLQPQQTGANPFRQSTLLPQVTGAPSFNGSGAANFPARSQSTNPFPTHVHTQSQQQQAFGQQQQQAPQPQFQSPLNVFAPSAGPSTSTGVSPFPSAQLNSPFGQQQMVNNLPPRPASAPLNALSANASSSNPSAPQSVITHQTGSRNPFGAIVTPVPPMPKPPTLFELSMNGPNHQNNNQSNQLQPQQTGFNPMNNMNTHGFGGVPSGNDSLISNIASSFSSNHSLGVTSLLKPQETSTTFSNSVFSSLSSQHTGATTTSVNTSPPVSASLQPQTTGFAGVKPFKPSSSFGAALLESLPPIPSAPSTPGESSQSSYGNGSGAPFGGSSNQSASALGTQLTGMYSAFNAQPTGTPNFGGSSVGVGLRPQATGSAGAANPFRATMFSTSPAAGTTGAFSGNTGTPSFLNSTPTSGFGASLFGSGHTGNFMGGNTLGTGAAGQPQQQQQNHPPSLI